MVFANIKVFITDDDSGLLVVVNLIALKIVKISYLKTVVIASKTKTIL